MATGYENNQQSGTAQGAGGQTAPDWDALKGDVGDMAGAAMEQGRHFLDSAKEQATGYVDQRKNDIARTVVGLADNLRQSGCAFEDRAGIQAIVESAAGGLEQLADSIQSRSMADMLGDVEALVRRQPVIAAAATMAAGFLLARFVKASADSFRKAAPRGGQSGGVARGQAYRAGQARA